MDSLNSLDLLNSVGAGQSGLDSGMEYCWGELSVCGGVHEDGPVMGISLLLEGPEMGGILLL